MGVTTTLLCLLLCFGVTLASVKTLSSSLSGTVNWNDASTWSDNVVPVAMDEVVLSDVLNTIIKLPSGNITVAKLTYSTAITVSGDSSGSTIISPTLRWTRGGFSGVTIVLTAVGSLFTRYDPTLGFQSSQLIIQGSVNMTDADGFLTLDTTGDSLIRIEQTGRLTVSTVNLGVDIGVFQQKVDCTLENRGVLELITTKTNGYNSLNVNYKQFAGASLLVTGMFQIGGTPYAGTIERQQASSYAGTITLLSTTTKLRLLFGDHDLTSDLTISGPGMLESVGEVGAASRVSIKSNLTFNTFHTENRAEITGPGTLVLQKFEFIDGLLNMDNVVNTIRLDVNTTRPGSDSVLQEFRGQGISVKNRLIFNANYYINMNSGANITAESTCFTTTIFLRSLTGTASNPGYIINNGYMEVIDNYYLMDVQSPFINKGTIKIFLGPDQTDYQDTVIAFYGGGFFNGFIDVTPYGNPELGRVHFGMKTTFENGLIFNNTGAVIIEGASLLDPQFIYTDTPDVIAQRTKTFTGPVTFKRVLVQPGAILVGSDITVSMNLTWQGATISGMNVVSNNALVQHDGLSGPKNVVDRSTITFNGAVTFDKSALQFINGGTVYLNKTSVTSVVNDNMMYADTYSMNGRMINDGSLIFKNQGPKYIGNGILENRGNLSMKLDQLDSKNKFEVVVVSNLIFTSTSTLFINVFNKPDDSSTYWNDYFTTNSVGEITCAGTLDLTFVQPPVISGKTTPTFDIYKADRFTLFVSQKDLITSQIISVKGSFSKLVTHGILPSNSTIGQRFNDKPTGTLEQVYYSGFEICNVADTTCQQTTGEAVDTTPAPSAGTQTPSPSQSTSTPTPTTKFNSAITNTFSIVLLLSSATVLMM